MAGSFTVGLLVVLLVAPIAVFGATYNVDWSLGNDYSSWATKEVKVGDTLAFTYGGGHTVDVVSKSAYSSCDASNPTFTDSSGSTAYKLTAEGATYIICGTPGHCPPMQLQVNVKAASSSSSSTPATTTPSTSTTTPSSTTTSTSPSTTSTSTTSSTTNGAPAQGLSWLVFSVSLVLGALFGFMG